MILEHKATRQAGYYCTAESAAKMYVAEPKRAHDYDLSTYTASMSPRTRHTVLLREILPNIALPITFPPFFHSHHLSKNIKDMTSEQQRQLLNGSCDGNLQDVLGILLMADPCIVNTMDEHGQTALLKACWRGHESVVHLLLKNNASTNLASNNGFTPLMVACEKGFLRIVEALLEKGANVDATSMFGETPLMWASFKGHLEIVRALIEKAADVNAMNKKKWTALMWASSFGHTSVVLELIARGASLRLKNSRGKTARDLAKDCKKTDIDAILLHIMLLKDQVKKLQNELRSNLYSLLPQSRTEASENGLSFLYMYDDPSDELYSSPNTGPDSVNQSL